MSWRAFLFSMLLLPLTAAAGRADPLDGQRWKITLTPDKATAEKGASEFIDTVAFAGGRFSSTALKTKGYESVKYRGDFEEREAEFEAEQTSETEGVAIWLGEIRGDRISGRLQWKKKDGTNLFFNFIGTREARG